MVTKRKDMMYFSQSPEFKLKFNHSATEALKLIKLHMPNTWLDKLNPYMMTLNCFRLLHHKTFISATNYYLSISNNQANNLYALASYKHIMSKIKEYQTVCDQLTQYRTQLDALEDASGYTHKAKADLRKHYQNKMTTLVYRKSQLLLHDEVIAGLQVVTATEISPLKNNKKLN